MSMMESIKKAAVPIHREGWRFAAVTLFVAIVLGIFWSPLFWIGLIITGWVCYFFRDPSRIVPSEEGLVVSPADGVVSKIGIVRPPPELELATEQMLRVSIFMNVFNCHINRAPTSGLITRLVYKKGKFLNAELDKASEHNERNGMVIESLYGTIAVVQIAGLVARRIVCNVAAGESISVGERFGLIRFGSRLDVYLPADAKIPLSIGQTMVAGETIITHLKGNVFGPYPNRVE